MLQRFFFYILLVSLISSCKKNEFLEAKPNSSIVVPQTLDELQALLDNAGTFNVFGVSPIMGEESADNYYLSYTSWQALPEIDRNTYIWASDIYHGTGGIPDWNKLYAQVFYCNVVLDNIANAKVNASTEKSRDNIIGNALFLRSFAFLNLASQFALAYDSSTASNDLGIVLKLQSDINVNPGRSTVKQTYDQIVTDLSKAAALLPTQISTQNPNRPSKAAAYALMARAYISMRSYANAMKYADSSLKEYHTLVNYNTLPAGNFPFKMGQPSTAEVLFQSSIMPNNALFINLASSLLIDSTLVSLYDVNDLRKSIYFRAGTVANTYKLGWSYTTGLYAFNGMATDEMYLVRAEGYARAGNTTQALADLDTLLTYRYKTGTFIPLTATSSADALTQVLQERRKELSFRGIRWTDIKRFNKEGAGITLKRILNGTTYILDPNSQLYALPIPADEIQLSGIQQNPR